MGRLADKYLVREFVAERIGEEYLVPLLGVWDDCSACGTTLRTSISTSCPRASL
jgi:hypothetical protein